MKARGTFSKIRSIQVAAATFVRARFQKRSNNNKQKRDPTNRHPATIAKDDHIDILAINWTEYSAGMAGGLDTSSLCVFLMLHTKGTPIYYSVCFECHKSRSSLGEFLLWSDV